MLCNLLIGTAVIPLHCAIHQRLVWFSFKPYESIRLQNRSAYSYMSVLLVFFWRNSSQKLDFLGYCVDTLKVPYWGWVQAGPEPNWVSPTRSCHYNGPIVSGQGIPYPTATCINTHCIQRGMPRLQMIGPYRWQLPGWLIQVNSDPSSNLAELSTIPYNIENLHFLKPAPFWIVRYQLGVYGICHQNIWREP